MKNKKKFLSLSLLFSATLPFAATAHNHATKGVEQSHRSEANIARDEFRKPLKTLDFFGVKATDKVVEIMPGGGWYTEVLAPMLSGKGELVAAHYPLTTPSEYRKRSRSNFEIKLADN